jgi:hypothetical protein
LEEIKNKFMIKNKVDAMRKIMEMDGDNPEEIEARLDLIRVKERKENQDSLRSWVAVIISAVALVVSILVAIYK